MNELEKELAEARKLTIELEELSHKAGVYAYNLERSFVENVKEISGTGWTAEGAKDRYGL